LATVTLFLQLTIEAVALAGIYALVAFGIQLVYGLTNIINFAHGAMLCLGAYLFATLIGATDKLSLRLEPWVAAIITVLALAGLGYLIERFLFRRTLRVPVSGFILSLGLILVLQNLYASIWSPFPIAIRPPLPQTFHWGGIEIAANQLLVIGLAISSMIVLLWWVKRSRYGRGLRACAEDREMARLLGVPVQRTISIAFMVGTGAAGLAGVLIALQTAISPQLGTTFVITGFTVALVGGLGSIVGAVFGALIVAGITSYASGYLPTEWITGYSFLLMLVVLLIRPSGIMGGATGGHL
jgi:branched-chain amino acid transport system permease protein